MIPSGSAARKIEWAICALFCLIVLSLQIVLYRHSGSFWRDETSSIQVACSPSFMSTWRSLWADSFPGLFDNLLRLWIRIGPGATDAGIRLLGTLIALGGVVSLLISFRALTTNLPLVALSLVAMNGSIFYYGSSIRAYGLAVLLIVPCFAAFWRVAASPTKKNIAAAFVLSLLTVHCNYQNCCLLLGTGVAGAAVCALCRLWKRALLILTIGFVAALSMLVYLPTIRKYREMTTQSTALVEWGMLAKNFAEALAGANTGLLVIWCLALSTVLFLLPYRYRRERRSQPTGMAPSLPLFSLIALATSFVTGAIFFRANMIVPYSWQFAPFIALAAVAVEIALDGASVFHATGKLMLACAIMGVSLGPAWRAAHLRRTNLDLVGAALTRDAGPDDLIIVTSSWLTPGFNYHYRGKTEWNTLPLIPSDRDSRLVPPIGTATTVGVDIVPALKKAGETLRAGHRVWSVTGWHANPLRVNEFRWFLQDHATRLRRIPIPLDQPVWELENVSLSVADGWR